MRIVGLACLADEGSDFAAVVPPGATLAAPIVRAGLVDEFRIVVAPAASGTVLLRYEAM